MNTQPRILITAGPTHEPIDRVRYLANRSSGRMGLALADAARRRNWPTTLLLGPTHLQLSHPASGAEALDDSQMRIIRFQTTTDLQRLLASHWPEHDVLFMAAAVADYRPVQVDTGPQVSDASAHRPIPDVSAADQTKLPRTDQQITLTLEPTPDLLAGLSQITRPDQFVVGFALEPADRLLASAQDKLRRKRIDAIVANPLETMDSPTVSATLITTAGSSGTSRQITTPGELPKAAFAEWLFGVLEPTIAERLATRLH